MPVIKLKIDNIGLDTGLALFKRQVIVWTNDDIDQRGYMRHPALTGKALLQFMFVQFYHCAFIFVFSSVILYVTLFWSLSL